ncbi:helix-turn-helix transcriptional regulator [Streptomyces tirandamycinicus]|uniref:helix-turn-helix transcriptional regulator n=1 Tax=Streptomyces tirandamycinicus TaxID=2174846 RepID=UPI001FCA2397|nr:LuxR family transcriptional regulator [Streptomyces tirandamycinicus]
MLHTRLIPPVLGPLLDRPRLFRTLDTGVTRRLTLVVGPPGAGKSALLASWARSLPLGEPAWLTLDADDNHVPRLLTHLAAALARATAARGGEGLRFSDGVSVPALLDEVSGHPHPLVLVVDAFHELRPGPARSALLQFARYAPGGLSVVLAGRREPDLPLHKLRAGGELTEIRGADLAFTHAETAALFRAHGAKAGDDQVAAVVRCSGGWALAVRYASVNPVRGNDPRSCLEGWSQAIRHCSDFLLSELLDPMPADDQDVLLRTSLLGEFSASLLRALTGRADLNRVLRRLSTEHDLLVRDDEWTYRLPNPLMRGVLSRELAERYGWPEVSRLLGKAARWYEDMGAASTARRYAAAAQAHAAGPAPGGDILLPPGLGRAGGGASLPGPAGDAARSPARSPGASPTPSPVTSPASPFPAGPDAPGAGPQAVADPLTRSELDVLRLLPLGLTLDEIADRRHVSLNTVKTQVQAVYRKLQVGRRRDAVRVAAERGLISPRG